jgi:hypothetical protein
MHHNLLIKSVTIFFGPLPTPDSGDAKGDGSARQRCAEA